MVSAIERIHCNMCGISLICIIMSGTMLSVGVVLDSPSGVIMAAAQDVSLAGGAGILSESWCNVS